MTRARNGPRQRPNRVGIVFFVKNRQAFEQTEAIASWLLQRGVEVVLEQECGAALNADFRLAPMETVARSSDLLVAVGGDGTLLNAARHAAPAGTPLLGVNKGTVGFLTELSPHQVIPGLERVLKGDFHVEPRLMLEVRVMRRGRILSRQLGLNDAVVKRGISRILHYNLSLDGDYLDSFPGDGVIVATPTGSTAYSLSAGGPIVKPDLDVLLICPICPHRFYGRSLIVDAGNRVEITFHRHGVEDLAGPESIHLTVDGQTTCTLDPLDTVQIRRSRHRTQLVRFADSDFFQVLREKLG